MGRRNRWARGGASILLLLSAAACELEEITIVDAEDVVVAEVYLNVAQDPEDNEIRAFLHRTLGTEDEIDDLLDARVEVVRSDGTRYELEPEAVDECVDTAPVEDPGACFVLDDSTTVDLAAGDVFEVTVVLVDGGRITGAAEVPGAFELDGIPGACRIPADAVMTIAWSRSEDAWAYLNETSIRDLPAALDPEGIEVDEDPLYLLGLSISVADTTIAFPSEFGVFNRIDLDQDLALRLQEGLPEGTSAEVSITAVDRNYVNWARGGNFNPSGQVRVPSLRGAGTGVFGATIGRTFQVFASDEPSATLPDCPGVRSGG